MKLQKNDFEDCYNRVKAEIKLKSEFSGNTWQYKIALLEALRILERVYNEKQTYN